MKVSKESEWFWGVRSSFEVIVTEVINQLNHTLDYIESPDDKLRNKIITRDDYIDNLKSFIDNTCFHTIFKSPNLDITSANFLRATNTITSNLERIADFAVNIVSQTKYLSSHKVMRRYKYKPLFKELLQSIEKVPTILFSGDMSAATDICNAEKRLDDLFKITFDRVMEELGKGGNPGDLVTVLNIFRYLERSGDSLQNIGEAIIFSGMGEKLKIEQYRALEDSVSNASGEISIDNLVFESIWESKSGCRIGRVSEHGENGVPAWAIFKEGAIKKIKEEKESLEWWGKVYPGLAPRVLDFRTQGDKGSLLMEHIGGHTFQDILLNGSHNEISAGFKSVTKTINTLWEKTKSDTPATALYMNQLESRLGDVFHLFPKFDYHHQRIGSIEELSFNELVSELKTCDESLESPFSVLIHGDLNLDNIIYYSQREQLHFIDLHRSKPSDYLQDISVCIVSAFRLPMFDNPHRERINWFAHAFYAFAEDFAKENGDRTFNIRLALGLARSFISSTRFILTYDFALSLFERGVYLLKKVNAHKGSYEDFVFPEDILTFRGLYD